MVTDRIVEQMQQGIVPWHQPWGGLDNPYSVNYITRKPYSLENQFLLGKSGEWLIWTQIQACHGMLRKGAKSRFVVFFTFIPSKGEELET